MDRPLHIRIGSMDFHNMSKCELLRELSGYNGCDHRGVTCKECRHIQKTALIEAITSRYVIKEKR